MSSKLFLITLVVFTLAGALSLFSIACGSAAPTATPVPTTQPGAPATPTPIRAATATAVPPTSTPVAMSEGPQYGGTLRAALTREFDNLDPGYIQLQGLKYVMFLLYNNVVSLRADGEVVPELAKSWDISSDGKAVTLHLESGIKFHDGTTLDASAVKSQFDRLMDSKVGSPRRGELTPPLESVQVIDSSTIKMNLATPFQPLIVTLTQQAGQIPSPTAIQKTNSYDDRVGKFGANPVGSGPFKFVEWRPEHTSKLPGTKITGKRVCRTWMIFIFP
ncbi:MAG: hypothetical protein HY663_04170 [Chloroflexi bacterium]|nr:hypothetical protein [Chloroflexota bacterium]